MKKTLLAMAVALLATIGVANAQDIQADRTGAYVGGMIGSGPGGLDFGLGDDHPTDEKTVNQERAEHALDNQKNWSTVQFHRLTSIDNCAPVAALTTFVARRGMTEAVDATRINPNQPMRDNFIVKLPCLDFDCSKYHCPLRPSLATAHIQCRQ